jgi:hypothetical protein
MWQVMKSPDDDDSAGWTVKTGQNRVRTVNASWEYQTKRPTSQDHQPHTHSPSYSNHQQLTGVKDIVTMLEKKNEPIVPPRSPSAGRGCGGKLNGENMPSESGASIFKNESSLQTSPKGVDAFDDGATFFDNFFSTENNPFRAAEGASVVSSACGWDHAMITGAAPGEGSDAIPSRLKASGTDEIISPRTKDPTLQHPASRLSHMLTGNIKTVTRDKSSTAQAETTRGTPAPSVVPGPSVGISLKACSKMRMYIDEYDSDFFRALMFKLIYDPKISKLDVYRSVPGTRTSSDMELFFRMVGSLSNLRTLFLSNMNGESDMAYFDDALSRHAKVKIIKLMVASGTITSNTIRTLKSMPRLAQLRLDSDQSFDVTPLLESPTLRRLHIASTSSHSFDPAHILSMVPILECNSTLTELDLEPKMSLLAFKALVHSLRINRSIKVLQVAIDWNSTEPLIHQAMSEVATVLTVNSSLRVLNNIHHDKLQVEPPCRRWILRGLEANVTIEHFLLFREDESFANCKRELVKPSIGNLVTPIGGGGSLYSSATNYRNGSLAGESSVHGSEASNSSEATTTIFCTAFDVLNLQPIAKASRGFLSNALHQSERALSFMAVGFSNNNNNVKKVKI